MASNGPAGVISGMTGPTESLEQSLDRQANATELGQGRIMLAHALGDGHIQGASQTFHLDRSVKVAPGTDFTAQPAALVTGPATIKERRVSRKLDHLAKSPYMQGLSAEYKMSSKEASMSGGFGEEALSVGTRRQSTHREKMARINATYKSTAKISGRLGQPLNTIGAKPSPEASGPQLYNSSATQITSNAGGGGSIVVRGAM